MTRLYAWALAIVTAAAILLGFGYRNEREARKRATHDATADSLARDTRDATAQDRTAQLVSDSTVTVYRDRWHTLPGRIDTATIPAEAREVLRSCAAAVTALETSCSRKDAVIAALRTELDHAKDPPPGPRLSWRIRGGRDLLAREWEGAAGPRYRVAGPLEAYAELGARPFRDSTGVRRNEARIVAGLEITFGRRRQ